MAKADRIKEEIGWLKVVFGLLIATDISLIAWLAQHFDSANPIQVFIALAAVGGVTIAVVWVNHMAYVRINSDQTFGGFVMEWVPIIALFIFLSGLGLVVREATIHNKE